MDKKTLLSAFNNHFSEFIEDIRRVFPENEDIETAETAFQRLRKANPKMLIMIFKEYVADHYQTQIEQGDLNYFISKDYSQDVSSTSQSYTILQKIDSLREPIRNMSYENQKKVLQYLKNLCKLSQMYCS
jgi:hypothetical protein